jgi:hypothetical protein
MVRLKCSRCEQPDQYRQATLIEKYHGDIRLPELLHKIAADRPKVGAKGNDPCTIRNSLADPSGLIAATTTRLRFAFYETRTPPD